jgi:hypothetical protein
MRTFFMGGTRFGPRDESPGAGRDETLARAGRGLRGIGQYVSRSLPPIAPATLAMNAPIRSATKL